MFDLFGSAYQAETLPLGIPYMGSKRKYADKLISRMMEIRPHAKYFVDLCGGGGAMTFAAMQKGMTVHYNEKQKDMADFMRFIFELLSKPKGKYGIFPDEYYQFITRDKFFELKEQSGNYAQFARICYSFGNNQRCYLFNPDLERLKHLAHDALVFRCEESLKSLNAQLGTNLTLSSASNYNQRRLDFGIAIKRAGKRLDLEQLERLRQLEQQIIITNLCYKKVTVLTPADETIVYFDPPYRDTAKYIEGLCHDELDEYFGVLPYTAFMSEYNAPFLCVNEIETRSTLSATHNGCKKVEKLYINPYGQRNLTIQAR